MPERSRAEGEKIASQRSVVANGVKIRALRKQRGLTQESLAAKAGLSQKTIATAEKSRAVDMNTMTLIADALAVGYDELAGPAGQPESNEGDINPQTKGGKRQYIIAVVAGFLFVGAFAWMFFPERGVDQLLRGHLWVAYNPSGAVVWEEEERDADEISAERMAKIEESIRKDLRVIKDNTTITGLITFGSDARRAQIPRWAKEEGFEAVIMGVFIHPGSDEGNKLQMDNAKAQTNADAYLLYYNQGEPPLEELNKYVDELEQATGRPVAARLDHREYIERGLTLSRIGDFDSPDVLEPWQNSPTPRAAFEQLQTKLNVLQKIIPPDRPVLLGMISLPSGPGDEYSEENQKRFFRMVLDEQFQLPPNMGLYFYDAFDPPPGTHTDGSPENYRGIFYNDRRPKPVVEVLNRP